MGWIKQKGKTKGGRLHHKETWWLNDAVNDVVKEKRRKLKQWKLGGSKEEYQLAKKVCMMLSSKPSQIILETQIQTMTEVRFLKWLGQSNMPIKM